MKNITLIRHAKSSWEFNSKDFDRDLVVKGLDNSIKCANEILKKINLNSIIWSSPALRAYKTAKIFTKSWSLDQDRIIIKPELYTFDSSQLEQIVKSCTNDTDNLILFGHNSAITDFVNKFGDILIDNVPTSGLVSINFETDNWNKISNGHTIKILFPRDI